MTQPSNLDPALVISRGGISPTPVPSGVDCHAVTFTGAAGPIVRLLPTELIAAEESLYAAVGLTLQNAEVVGSTQIRAIGFPAWTVLTDPEHAATAFQLLPELDWARRTAATQPKLVQGRIDELAQTLLGAVPQCVPTFLEEVARIYRGHGQLQLAQRFFTKARAAEAAHQLPIDPQRHRAVFREFAVTGVLAGQELTAEAKAALQRAPDAAAARAAVAYLCELNETRCAAGQAPYPAMLSDLKRAARQAGIDEDEIREAVTRILLTTRQLVHTPRPWIAELTPQLTAAVCGQASWCTLSPQEVVTLLCQRPFDGYSASEWFGVLADTGAVEVARRNPEQWAEFLLTQATRNDQRNERLIGHLLEAAPLLAGRDVPVPRLNRIPLDHVDALCAVGVELRVDPAGDYQSRHVSFADWAGPLPYADERRRPRDLVALAAHPTLGPAAVEALDVAYDRADSILTSVADQLLSTAGGRSLLTSYYARPAQVRDLATAVRSAGITIAQQHRGVEELLRRDPRGFPAAVDCDAAELLATALRDGVVQEYADPALEQALAEVLGPLSATTLSQIGQVRFFSSHPDLIVQVEDRLIVLPAHGPTRHYQLPNADPIAVALTVAEDVAVIHGAGFQAPATLCWVSDLSKRVPVTPPSTTAVETSLWHPAGRLIGGALWSPRTPLPPLVGLGYFSTDSHIWRFTVGGSDADWECVAIDPHSGAVLPPDHASLARITLPDSGREVAVPQPLAALADTLTAPVASLTLTESTVTAQLQLLIGRLPDRRQVIVSSTGVLRAAGYRTYLCPRPGGGRWVRGYAGLYAVSQQDTGMVLLDTESTQLLTPLLGSSRWLLNPAIGLVGRHQTRSEVASQRLRDITAEQVRPLLDILRGAAIPPVELLAEGTHRYGAMVCHETIRPPTLDRYELAVPGPGTPAWIAAAELLGVADAAPTAAVARRPLAQFFRRLTTSGSPAVEDTTAPLIQAVIHFALYALSVERATAEVLEIAQQRLAALPATESAPPQEVDWSLVGDVVAGLTGYREAVTSSLPSELPAFLDLMEAQQQPPTSTARAAALQQWRHGQAAPQWIITAYQHPQVVAILAVLHSSAAMGAVADCYEQLLAVDPRAFAQPLSVGLVSGAPGSLRRLDRPEFTLPGGQTYVGLPLLGRLPGDSESGRIIAGFGPLPEDLNGQRCRPYGEPARMTRTEVTALISTLRELQATGEFFRLDTERAIGFSDLPTTLGISPGAWRYLAAGAPLRSPRNSSPLDNQWHERIGITAAEVVIAMEQLRPLSVAALVEIFAGLAPEGQLRRLLTEGVDLRAAGQVMAKVKTHSPLVLTQLEEQELRRLAKRYGAAVIGELTRLPFDEVDKHDPHLDMQRVVGWLNLAAWRDGDDPQRVWLGEQLQVAKEYYARHPEEAAAHLLDVEFGSSYSDGGLTPLQAESQAPRVLVDGHADALIASLLAPPTYRGPGRDPRRSAPGAVAAVSELFGLSEDAAVVYLQLLALASPTDQLIRRINEWPTRRHAAAVAELDEHALVEQGKRPGAGRTVFLPGGWLRNVQGSGVMATWTSRHYLLWEDAAVRPVVKGNPPVVPYEQLFADVVERLLAGDRPGPEELDLRS